MTDLFTPPEPERSATPPMLYVAAPYRAKTTAELQQNVAVARHIGKLAARKGWFPVMPTVNTAMFDRDFPDLDDDEFWLEGTAELMRRCDAVVMSPGWSQSAGARAELLEAQRRGIPVFMSVDDMPSPDVFCEDSES